MEYVVVRSHSTRSDIPGPEHSFWTKSGRCLYHPRTTYPEGEETPECVDCRMWKRQESPAAYVKAESRVQTSWETVGLEWSHTLSLSDRCMLRDDHRIVSTRGDLHPRNTLATSKDEK
ncbi:hypothetical protein VTO42DRAFT_4975 [Malbranchea cinnamomea]